MIDAILSFEKPVMLFFQSLRVNFLCSAAEVVSFLGESVWTMILIFFIYLVIDKRRGFGLGATVMTSHILNGILKVIFRIPRPWVKYPGEIIPLRQSTATGYSFPSGHSSLAGALYYGTYRIFRNRAVRVISVILLSLIPLSRVYLGVHWPLDVICGLGVGMLTASFVEKFVALYDNAAMMRKISMVLAPVFLVLGLIDAVLVDTGVLERILWKDLAASFAAWTGVFLAGALERRYVNFAVPEKKLKAVLLFLLDIAVGYALTLLWTGKIKAMHYTVQVFAYIVLILWAVFLCPMIYVRLGLYRREEN